MTEPLAPPTAEQLESSARLLDYVANNETQPTMDPTAYRSTAHFLRLMAPQMEMLSKMMG